MMPAQAARALAIANNHLYYTTETSGGVGGEVFRAQLISMALPEKIAGVPDPSKDELRGIAVAGDFVYWGEVHYNTQSQFIGRIRGMRLP